MIDKWILEIKNGCDPQSLGMILVHNGVVRGTDKKGEKVLGMKLTYDKYALENLLRNLQKRKGIAAIKAWINEGRLNVGDDIMYLLVAGRFRTDVLPVLQELLSAIKNEIVHEEEFTS